jgi:hypothetical protein
MPILLQPTPRRIHRTRENYLLGRPTRLQLPVGIPEPVEAELRAELEGLFPDLGAEPDEEGSALLSFAPLADSEEVAEVPAAARSEALRVEVSPEAIMVEAGSPVGWLRAARLLRGLREGDELVGLSLLDWPSFSTRQIDLPGSAADWSEDALKRWLRLMAQVRLNRLGLAAANDGAGLPKRLRALAEMLGITVGERAAQPTFQLLTHPSTFPAYSTLLPVLHTAAGDAEAAGAGEFCLDMGAVDARTSLEALVFGLVFAGDCAWNPRKADLKAHRRWYSARRFGLDSRSLLQTTDELEAALQSMAPMAGPEEGGALLIELEAEDPFDSPRFASILQPEERAIELGRHAAAALQSMAPLQPDSEERAAALQGLQWTAQRLKILSRRLQATDEVRQLYRAAHVAAASPRAVSQRLLRAADVLETEAKTLEEHRIEWHALWRRERQEPFDPETEALLRRDVERFRSRAARLRDQRSRYIQTGKLPSPAEEGLERSGAHLSEGLVPSRLPPQPSPAWWPEGGAARLRVEVDCPPEAAGMPWPVQADFRALAGETGAFNVRSARLLPLTENDEAGPEQPCQLLRAGFVFVPEAGQHTYFLYLDPHPGPDSGFRETRASQSRSALRLENRRMQVRLSPADGTLSGWRLMEEELELLPDGGEAVEEGTRAPGWKLRVLETGPLLARARAEHSSGHLRQFDLRAGQSWVELSTNGPWEEFLLPLRPGVGNAETQLLVGTDDGATSRELSEQAVEAEDAAWLALHRPDGLTLAVLAASPTDLHVSRSGIRLPHWPARGSVRLFAGRESDPTPALARVRAAGSNPPLVRLGVIEERRVREF